jgi:hypothetical protein
MRIVHACVFALALAACGNPAGDDSSAQSVLSVSPGTATLHVVGGAPVMQAYTATLTAPDGTATDVTADVAWAIDSVDVGYFDHANLVALHGGRATVSALLDTLTADATIEVFTADTRVGDGAPANAPDLFGSATDDPNRPATIIYPPANEIVPPNLGAFDLHWSDTTGSDLFELKLSTYYSDVRVYLGADASAGTWMQLLETEWRTLATSEVGATIDVSVRGLTVASPATSSHATERITTSREDIEGGIYYWAAASSNGAPEGIYRHDMGHPEEVPEQFYTKGQTPLDADGHPRCVACHALARDGTKMAITYDGGDRNSEVLDVATRATIEPMDTYAWNFASFTPDAAKLITVHGGVMVVRNPETGAVLAPVPQAGAGHMTHPDLSAQGDHLVYVAPSGYGNDWTFTGGSLAYRTYDQPTDAFGEEHVIVTSAGENNYYPSYSPDGQWVLFNRSYAGPNADGDAYNDQSAELWVVKADGSQPPIRLDLANIGGGLTNSWARWAPFDATWGDSHERIFWLTFSSKRDFGVRLRGVGQPQIWMTPFFPDRAANHQDPTAPAFWLPFQDIGTSNHIAQWTNTIIPVQ